LNIEERKGIVKVLSGDIDNLKIRKTSEVNAEFVAKNYEKPYDESVSVIEVKIGEEQEFVRVFANDKSSYFGKWVARKEDLKGLSPPEIK